MKLNEIKHGYAYQHAQYGPCWIVGPHPHDGCALIVAYNDTEQDEEKFVLAIPEDLEYALTGPEYKPLVVSPPPYTSDPHSPPAGEAGEHQHLYLYVAGNYHIGHVRLEGFTLISNNDLAQLKAGVLPPPAPAPELPVLPELTATDRALLKAAVEAAADWRGNLTGNPDPEPLRIFDAQIAATRAVLKKINARARALRALKIMRSKA